MRLKKRPWGDVVIENNLDLVVKQDELDLDIILKCLLKS